MRPKLLKSFIAVTVFWFIATTLWWSFQKPEVNYAAIARLKELLPFLPFEVPAEVSILGSLKVQYNVIAYWTLPVLIAAALSGLSGYGLVWLKAKGKFQKRKEREAGAGNFRGVTLTVGELPVPKSLPKDDIDLGGGEELGDMTAQEKKLLEDILGTISAHPNAYAGEGITVPLLDHALNITSAALTRPKNPALCAIVAAAHELGKLTAYTRKGDEWVSVKNHDRESAKILGFLDSWFALPTKERNAVMMAVKFHSKPKSMPQIDSDPAAQRLALDLLYAHGSTQKEVVEQEKQRTLEKVTESTPLPDVVLTAFLKGLPQLSFQNRDLPKGVAAVAWKVGLRVYLLEIKLRDTVMPKLPEDVRGALTASGREKSRLQPFTQELLNALDAKGWLVKSINGINLNAKDAIWNIKAGKLEFKGVIIIDIPEEYKDQLPRDDSMYPISVTGALFTVASGPSVSKNDLLGSVLRAPSAQVEPIQE